MKKKDERIILLIVIILIVSFISTLYKFNNSQTFLESFSSDYLATAFGVIIGIPFALWISNIQNMRIESDKRPKVLSLIHSELLNNLHTLRWHLDADGHSPFDFDENYEGELFLLKNSGFLISSLKHVIWDTLSDSGEMKWINNLELLSLITFAYYQIKSYKPFFEWIVEDDVVSEVRFLSDKGPGHNFTRYGYLLAHTQDVIDHIQEALKAIEKNVEIKDKADLTETFQHG